LPLAHPDRLSVLFVDDLSLGHRGGLGSLEDVVGGVVDKRYRDKGRKKQSTKHKVQNEDRGRSAGCRVRGNVCAFPPRKKGVGWWVKKKRYIDPIAFWFLV